MVVLSLVRVMMLVSNLLIVLAGLALMAVGIWVTVDGGSFLNYLGPFTQLGMQYVNVGYLCIAIGAVLVSLGVLGCCGTHKESKCLLLLVFSIVLVIFIAEVAAAVVALAYSFFAEDILKSRAAADLITGYGSDPELTKMWDTTMTEMECCGFSNFTDFMGSTLNENGGSLPPVCCWTDTAPCSPLEAERSDVQGCFQQILEWVRKHAHILGGIAASVGALEIVAMAVSMYLYCHLHSSIR